MIGPLIGLAALIALIAWLGGRARRGRTREAPAIDTETLEAAERDVRDLGAGARPDEFEGDDWGPGASRHRS